MKTRQKGWFFPPEKPPRPQVPENVKMEGETKAAELIELFLKPEYIKPTREDKPYNYIAEIYARDTQGNGLKFILACLWMNVWRLSKMIRISCHK